MVQNVRGPSRSPMLDNIAEDDEGLARLSAARHSPVDALGNAPHNPPRRPPVGSTAPLAPDASERWRDLAQFIPREEADADPVAVGERRNRARERLAEIEGEHHLARTIAAINARTGGRARREGARVHPSGQAPPTGRAGVVLNAEVAGEVSQQSVNQSSGRFPTIHDLPEDTMNEANVPAGNLAGRNQQHDRVSPVDNAASDSEREPEDLRRRLREPVNSLQDPSVSPGLARPMRHDRSPLVPNNGGAASNVAGGAGTARPQNPYRPVLPDAASAHGDLEPRHHGDDPFIHSSAQPMDQVDMAGGEAGASPMFAPGNNAGVSFNFNSFDDDNHDDNDADSFFGHVASSDQVEHMANRQQADDDWGVPQGMENPYACALDRRPENNNQDEHGGNVAGPAMYSIDHSNNSNNEPPPRAAPAHRAPAMFSLNRHGGTNVRHSTRESGRAPPTSAINSRDPNGKDGSSGSAIIHARDTADAAPTTDAGSALMAPSRAGNPFPDHQQQQQQQQEQQPGQQETDIDASTSFSFEIISMAEVSEQQGPQPANVRQPDEIVETGSDPVLAAEISNTNARGTNRRGETPSRRVFASSGFLLVRGVAQLCRRTAAAFCEPLQPETWFTTCTPSGHVARLSGSGTGHGQKGA